MVGLAHPAVPGNRQQRNEGRGAEDRRRHRAQHGRRRRQGSREGREEVGRVQGQGAGAQGQVQGQGAGRLTEQAMKLFPYGHATHPQWQMAAGLVLAQLRAQMALHGYASAPTLGLLYITDHYTAQAQDILDFLGGELPEITDWAGTVGVGIASNNVEYFDEPAMAVMLCELSSDLYRVFSGVSPLPPAGATHFQAHTALV